jgi:hypothetical protein
MPTQLRITSKLRVQALLDIDNAEFAHWYELGVWWAMYGDEQGRGPYDDSYLIDTIGDGLRRGWYNSLLSGWFPMVGLKIGMIHGGMLDPATRLVRSSASLVVLRDSDFTRGYQAGRRYYFFEGGNEERLTDARLVEFINSWALEYHDWREPEQCLRFALGGRIGELSGQLIPMGEQERARIEEEDRLFMVEYEASRSVPMVAAH